MEGNVDLLAYLLLLKRRALVVVLTVAVAIGASAVYAFVLARPQYTANTVLFVWRTIDPGQDPAMTYSDLIFNEKLVSDYRELCKSRNVISQVAEANGLSASSAAALSAKIDVTTKSNTRLLLITVTDQDPVFAANIANSVAQVFMKVVVEKMGAENVQVIDTALIPSVPSSPNKPMDLLIGLVAGLAAGVGLAFLIDFLDRTVKSIEEIESITGKTLLGVVPEFETED